MSRCASCFTPLPLQQATVRCSEPSCAKGGSRGTGTDDPRGDATVPLPAPIDDHRCPDCDGRMAEVCPVCRYRLPVGWRAGRSICLVMAGARSTGKSVYIGVALTQLQQLGRIGTTVRPADAETEAVFTEQYSEPLFGSGDVLKSTASAASEDAYQHTPLVFAMRMPDGSRFFLAVRDVAGEDLEPVKPNDRRKQIDGRKLDFFSRADGIVFLVDPQAVPAVRANLAGTVHAQFSEVDPLRVLERVLELIRGSRPRVAVVLSKFDALQALADVEYSPLQAAMRNYGAAFLRDPGPLTGYDHDDTWLLHFEIRSLLQRLGAGALLGTLDAEAHSGLEHRLFAVSALGGNPSGKSVSTRGITPFRCMDPIKWLMATAG